MNSSELTELLGRLEESPAPEPSAVFVAKLEADLRAMDQTVEVPVRRPARTRRARVLIAAGPIAALTAAAAAAAVTLLPAKPHERELKTADPGVTAPAPSPETTVPSVSTPTTLPAGAPVEQTTTTVTATVSHPAPTTPVTRPNERSTPTVVLPHEPVATTAPPAPTTTTVPLETPSFHCTAGVTGGQNVAYCVWSQSTRASFAWYRLYREVPGTNRVLVFSSDNRSTTNYVDKTVQPGTTYSYQLEVTDDAGHVIGRTAAFTVNCC